MNESCWLLQFWAKYKIFIRLLCPIPYDKHWCGLNWNKNILPYFIKTFENGTFLHGCCPERGSCKTKQTTTKKSKHNFWHNDKEESDIERKKNDNKDNKDNKDDKDNHADKDDNDEVLKNSFLERNNNVAVQVQLVSDKNNVTGIIDLLLEDAPATKLPRTLEAAIKNVVDTALF